MAGDLSLKIRINADGSAAVQELRRVGAATEGAGSAAAGATAPFAGLAGSLAKVGAAVGGALAIKELTTAFVSTASEGQKLRGAFEAVTGSAGAARSELTYAAQVAADLGINADATAKAWLNLSAAAKGTALEGQNARGIFEAVGQAMAKLGKSADDTQGALLAIEQMISKGTVSAEELRGQLGERLPGAFGIAAKAMGVTTQELDAMLAKGEVLATDLLPKMAAELARLYDTGRVSTLSAEWERLKGEVVATTRAIDEQNGIVDGLASMVRALAKEWRDARLAASGASGFAIDAGGWEDDIQRVNAKIVETKELIRSLEAMSGGTSSEQFGRISALERNRAALAGLQRELQQYLQLAAEDREVTQGAAQSHERAAKATADQAAAAGKLKGLNAEFSGGLQAMIQAAAADGVTLGITSGLRSSEQQAKLWADALAKYGSAEIARKWVAPPGKSMHEKGLAADIKATGDGYKWLAENAERFGLTLPLANERWHVELIGARNAKDATAALAKQKREEAAAYKEAKDAAIDGTRAQYTAADAYAAALAPMEQYIAGLKGQAAQAGMTAAEQAKLDAQTRISGMIQEATANQTRAAQKAVEEAMRTGRPVNMAIADSYGAAAQKLREMTPEALKLAEASVQAGQATKDNLPTVQELWTKTVENLAQSIQGTLGDAFEQLFSGTLKSAKDAMSALKTVVVRALADLAAAVAMRPITVAIQGALVGSAGSAQAATGAGSAASGGSSLSSLSGVANLFGGNGLGLSAGRAISSGLGMLGYTGSPGYAYSMMSLANAPNWALGGGGLAGSFLGSTLFQGGYSQIGASMGSAAGSVLGPMLASSLAGGPLGVTAAALASIAGGLLGGSGGGWLGSLFGSSAKPPTAYIATNQGNFSSGTNEALGGDNAAIRAAAQAATDLVDQIAGVLGDGAKSVLNTWNQATQPMTGEQVQGWLTERVSSMISAMTNSTSGLIGELAREAWESSGHNIDAFKAQIGTLQAVMQQLPAISQGLRDAGVNLGADAQASTVALLKMAGGLDQLTASQQAYATLFGGTSGALGDEFASLKAEMKRIGWETIPAREGLKAWIDSLDMSNESNRASRLAILAQSDALARYYDSLEQAKTAAETAAETTQDLADATVNLAKAAADSAKALADARGQYRDLFMGDDERLAVTARDTAAALGALGLSLPQTRQQMRALVDALDLGTESGRGTYVAVMSLASGLDAIYDAAEAALAKTDEARQVSAKELADFTASLAPVASGSQSLAAMSQAFASWGLALPPTSAALYDLIRAGAYTGEQMQWLARHADDLGRAWSELDARAQAIAAAQAGIAQDIAGIVGASLQDVAALMTALRASLASGDAARIDAGIAAAEQIRQAITGNLQLQLSALQREYEARKAADVARAQSALDAAQAALSSAQAERTRQEAIRQSGESILDWVRSLRTGAGSYLSDSARAGEAQRQYQSALRAVRGGDTARTGDLTSGASAYLESLKATAGSATEYGMAAARVAAEMIALGTGQASTALTDTDYYQRAVELAQQQLAQASDSAARDAAYQADIKRLQDAAVVQLRTLSADLAGVGSVAADSATAIVAAIAASGSSASASAGSTPGSIVGAIEATTAAVWALQDERAANTLDGLLAEVAALRAEVAALRGEAAQRGGAQLYQQSRTADTLWKWDNDGMPDARGSSGALVRVA